jgi:hypothetical protein
MNFVTDWLHSDADERSTALPAIWNMNITSADVLLNVKSALC